MTEEGGEGNTNDTREFDLDLVAIDEARRTIDKQNEVLNNIDDKAARILRINLVVVGILLSGLSLAMNNSGQQTDPLVKLLPAIVNVYTELGMVALLLSTAFAAVTYTASALRIGVSGDSLRQIVFEGTASDRDRLRGLADSYASWIQTNHRTNAFNAPLATVTLILLVCAVTFFLLGGLEALRDVRGYELAAVVVFLVIFTHSTGITGQIRRYVRLRAKTDSD